MTNVSPCFNGLLAKAMGLRVKPAMTGVELTGFRVKPAMTVVVVGVTLLQHLQGHFANWNDGMVRFI